MAYFNGCNVLLRMLLVLSLADELTSKPPSVITTWNLPEASEIAWLNLESRSDAIDAVVEGCAYCERKQCRMTVGYGGSPDESGETTLDALVMDGTTMDVGAVGDLREIKEAIAVAKHVLQHTEHSLLVGELATQFAVNMGFKRTSLMTEYSKKMWHQWMGGSCQPNFWKNVTPNPRMFCGPYKPIENCEKASKQGGCAGFDSHDTIGMVAMDSHGNVAAGTSTNGLQFKIPGRVGDSPIAGSGGYADSEVGGAAATGNGDILMRFMPSFHATELMRSGMTPSQATETVVRRISKFYPTFYGAVIAMSTTGEFGAACYGYEFFPFTARNASMSAVKSFNVTCV